MSKATFFNLQEDKRKPSSIWRPMDLLKMIITLLYFQGLYPKRKLPREVFTSFIKDKRDLYSFLIELSSQEKSSVPWAVTTS